MVSPTPNEASGKASGDQNSPSPLFDSTLQQRSNTAYSTTKTLLHLPTPSDPSVAEQGSAGMSPEARRQSIQSRGNVVLSREEEFIIQPGYLPPTYPLLDLFPFSIIMGCLSRHRKRQKGRKVVGARRVTTATHNIPLEISLYLVGSSFYDGRKFFLFSRAPISRHYKNENFWMFLQLVCDFKSSILIRFGDRRPDTLLQSLNQLVDSLTGLERILTTPIPYSYVFDT